MSPGYDNSTGILIVQIMTGSGINYPNFQIIMVWMMLDLASVT